jgi:hypothetical protein
MYAGFGVDQKHTYTYTHTHNTLDTQQWHFE